MQKMINFDDVTKKTLKNVIIGGSESGKKNSLFNLIRHHPKSNKIYFYANNPHEAKYQLLINKRESTGLNNLNNSFIEYSNDMTDIYEKKLEIV